MRCPYCSSSENHVIDSRSIEDDNSIRRRRVCIDCKRRFTTYEKVETIPLMVVKKDCNREVYDRAKIEQGVLRACHKRPIPAEDISSLVDSVELAVFEIGEGEIASSVIGELVMDRLKDMDTVAYVRFASVYREFKDINSFLEELYSLTELHSVNGITLMRPGARGS